MNFISKISSLALYTIFALSLHAATFYVASPASSPIGSDSNPGTQAAPWQTVQHAINNMSCGDTLNVVADGNYVLGDVTSLPSALTSPNFANCGGKITAIQSSKLGNFSTHRLPDKSLQRQSQLWKAKIHNRHCGGCGGSRLQHDSVRRLGVWCLPLGPLYRNLYGDFYIPNTAKRLSDGRVQ